MDVATELEAIRRLKYAYFRTLDLKQFDQLGLLLTEDATAAYEDAQTTLDGREAIVTWLTDALGGPCWAAIDAVAPSSKPRLRPLRPITPRTAASSAGPTITAQLRGSRGRATAGASRPGRSCTSIDMGSE